MPILTLLVGLIIILAVFWAARALMAAFGVGEPVATVIYVVLVILAIYAVLSALGVVNGSHLRVT